MVPVVHQIWSSMPRCRALAQTAAARWPRAAEQWQVEMGEMRPLRKRFRVAVGRCRDCGRRAQGHHPDQVSPTLWERRLPKRPACKGMGHLISLQQRAFVGKGEGADGRLGIVATARALCQAAKRSASTNLRSPCAGGAARGAVHYAMASATRGGAQAQALRRVSAATTSALGRSSKSRVNFRRKAPLSRGGLRWRRPPRSRRPRSHLHRTW